MHNKTSNLGLTPAGRLLKDQITQIESTLRHLHSVIGGHINTLDKTLIKGENVKPVKTRSHLLKAAASPLSAGGIFSDFIRSLGGVAKSSGGQSAGGSDLSFDGGSSGMSQGQIWAQAASAISRAMKRNL